LVHTVKPQHSTGDWNPGFEKPGPGVIRRFCQTRNLGLRAAKTRVSG